MLKLEKKRFEKAIRVIAKELSKAHKFDSIQMVQLEYIDMFGFSSGEFYFNLVKNYDKQELINSLELREFLKECGVQSSYSGDKLRLIVKAIRGAGNHVQQFEYKGNILYTVRIKKRPW